MKTLRRTWIIVLALGLPLMTTACNQQIQDALEKEGIELQQNTQKQEAVLSPLVGRYEGALRHSDSRDEKSVALIIVPTTIIVQNPGRNDITQYPSLAGTLNVILPPLDSEDKEHWVTIAHYDMASFDKSTGRLTLTGAVQTGAIGAVKVHLDGIVHPDNSLTARISTSLKGEIGTLELKKVADELR